MSEPRALEHYRVERERSAVLDDPTARKGGLFRRARTAATVDTIRVYDRQGAVVMERELGDTKAAEAMEHQIVDDLLKLGVEAFRLKWGLAEQ